MCLAIQSDFNKYRLSVYIAIIILAICYINFRSFRAEWCETSGVGFTNIQYLQYIFLSSNI